MLPIRAMMTTANGSNLGSVRQLRGIPQNHSGLTSVQRDRSSHAYALSSVHATNAKTKAISETRTFARDGACFQICKVLGGTRLIMSRSFASSYFLYYSCTGPTIPNPG